MAESKKVNISDNTNKPSPSGRIKPNDSADTKSPDRLWKDAIDKYAKEYDISSRQLESASEFDEKENGVQKARKLFQQGRHPPTRARQAEEAIGGCLDWIESTVQFASGCTPDGVYDRVS